MYLAVGSISEGRFLQFYSFLLYLVRVKEQVASYICINVIVDYFLFHVVEEFVLVHHSADITDRWEDILFTLPSHNPLHLLINLTDLRAILVDNLCPFAIPSQILSRYIFALLLRIGSLLLEPMLFIEDVLGDLIRKLLVVLCY